PGTTGARAYRPLLVALRLTTRFPSTERGPVLRNELRRFVLILASDVAMVAASLPIARPPSKKGGEGDRGGEGRPRRKRRARGTHPSSSWRSGPAFSKSEEWGGARQKRPRRPRRNAGALGWVLRAVFNPCARAGRHGFKTEPGATNPGHPPEQG